MFEFKWVFIMILLILATVQVITQHNVINSLLFLVMVFIAVTFLLIKLNVEYIGMLILIVYLGAMMVLFLFVVMLLDIRSIELHHRFFSYHIIGIFLLFGTGIYVFSLLNLNFIFSNNNIESIYFFIDNFIHWKFNLSDITIDIERFLNPKEVDNLKQMGLKLFTNFALPFVLSGVLLLIAMLGAITLVNSTTKKSKYQNFYTQTSKKIFDSVRKLK